jgi:hypothetical protein
MSLSFRNCSSAPSFSTCCFAPVVRARRIAVSGHLWLVSFSCQTLSTSSVSPLIGSVIQVGASGFFLCSRATSLHLRCGSTPFAYAESNGGLDLRHAGRRDARRSPVHSTIPYGNAVAWLRASMKATAMHTIFWIDTPAQVPISALLIEVPRPARDRTARSSP